MFQIRKPNNNINKIRERALLVTNKDDRSSFNVLLNKGNSVTIHQGHTKILTAEIPKRKINITPKIIVFWIDNNLIQLTV